METRCVGRTENIFCVLLKLKKLRQGATLVLTPTEPSLCEFSTEFLRIQREIQYVHGDFQCCPSLFRSFVFNH